VAIIVVSIAICGALVKYFFFSESSQPDQPRSRHYIQKGQKVALEGVNWSRNGKTLLLVLQKGCRFCTDSAPFYKKLVDTVAKRPDTHLIAVFPQTTDEGKDYLDELGVPISDIRQQPLTIFPIQGTPTLILVDNAGLASEVWIGKLKPEKEAEVLSRL
jgi:thioredoxin-related protein